MKIPIPEIEERFNCIEDAIAHTIRISNVIVEKAKGVFPDISIAEVSGYVLEICKKILTQATTIINVSREKKDYNTVCSLVRILADNVAVLRLVYYCDEEEKTLRHLLYVLDGVSHRYRLLNKHPIASYSNKVPRETYDTLKAQVQGTIENAAKCMVYCTNAIKMQNCYIVHSDDVDVLIEKCNWKFKTITKPRESYSWSDMYELLEIKNAKDMFSYFSQYVHGLSISNIALNDKDDFDAPMSFTFCLVYWIFNFLRQRYEPYIADYTWKDIQKMVPELFE